MICLSQSLPEASRAGTAGPLCVHGRAQSTPMIRADVLAAAAGLILAGGAGAGTQLAGPTWQLAKLAGVSRGVSAVTARFTADGKVSGFSGCNQYSGTYTTSGTSISVSKVAVTQMACAKPQTLLERAYLRA